ncbi:2-dehydro-3-deoxygalactonokinase [Microbulbifer halophilus]|uniref:2-dehydro-3-deoxygalactonokinase n=1 Tax=Microbulbifer halophilus TaxID=453963 RepID=A0ABW5E6Z8_9GAMM|nr:2-dehydro-3-deoxygalactonokinase [Microbulbifer halophilus]MCW8125882.1 2-dehydro-3-deoxygalactonokinase [Microbulbifer halophilus]
MQRIVVDWGTTNIRAHLIDDDGRALVSRSGECGVQRCDGDYAAVLGEYCSDWQHRWPGIPTYLCGMIGSRTGWQETPYVPCPVEPPALAAGLKPLAGRDNIFFVPGVQCRTPAGTPDVMRGEECQVLGALAISGLDDGVLILPGTHSKWVRVRGGRIVDFATFFTGELFALLHRHSSIGSVLDAESMDAHSFDRGLAQSCGKGGLLHQVFSARSRSLCEDTGDQSMSAYLSGILIGSEFAHALSLFPPAGKLLLVGDRKLGNSYRQAAQHFDLPLQPIDPALAVVRGVKIICDAAGDHSQQKEAAGAESIS